ncbi:hypothetical protein PVAND_015921 [Polypedilum vanderplanki]|uniref:NACHT domain-containing protein n=1 Tax=Polypedilum vanderplanki TaxID=319348 RepID=A0A9J6BE30_POLVA|nr:hypothetical protein PVAND_015921 [Polypedilum vanderplanki]
MDSQFSGTFSLDFSDNLNEVLQSKENKSKILIILKIPSIDKATKLITQEIFLSSIFKNFPSLIGLRLQIENKIEEPTDWQPRICDFENKSHFLISFESSEGNQRIIYWKNKDSQVFFKLLLIDDGINSSVKEFALNFIIEEFLNGDEVTTTNNSNNVTLTTLFGASSNLLINAVWNENLEIVRELLKLPFDVNEEILIDDEENEEMTENLINYPWENENFEIVLELLKANSLYPKKFDESKATDEINDFLEISEDLHKAIKRNKIKSINEILDENPNLRYFFNSKNISAAKFALQCKNSAAYKILYDHNVTFGPNENISGNYEPQFKELIRNINSDLSNSLPERHILLLLSQSVIAKSDINYGQRLNLIKESFEILDEFSEIHRILKIIAADRKNKIHFDFTQNSVIYMDLSARKGTRGLFNSKIKTLHIAAKNLLDFESRNETIAILIHELDHCALDLVFLNKRLPFGIDDEENKKKFQEIVEDCKIMKDDEDLIGSVFKFYPESAWERELAVRPVHMMIHYKNNQKMLRICQNNFKMLFDYHENVVVPAMIQTLPVIEKLKNFEEKIEFYDLSEPMKSSICHLTVEFQGVKIKLKEIAGEKNSEVYKNLTSKQIRKILNGKDLTICKVEKFENEIYIERSFIDSNFKSELWNKSTLLYSKLDARTLEYCEAIKFAKYLNSILSEVQNTRIFLLSDDVGTGKSTTFKNLSRNLKEKFPNFWISFIDLKMHLKVFEKFEKNFTIQNARVKILEILENILNFSTDFENSIFTKLYHENKLILFFDGVDEISPKFKEFFINFIQSFHILTKNQIWISTRPQYCHELMIRNQKSYKLLQFSKNDSENFIRKFLKNKILDKEKFENEQKIEENSEIKLEKNFTIDDKIEEKLKEIQEISSKFQSIENPLMLKMLIELSTVENFSLKNFNRFSLYEAIVELKKEILAEEKGALANKDSNVSSRMTLWEVHQIYALKLIFEDEKFEDLLNDGFLSFNQTFINFNEFQLFKKWQKEKSKWTPDAISRCGFLSIINWNTENEMPIFSHRTFAEFFVVKFLIENIEEAIEADDDEISDKEFELRIKFALFIVKICGKFHYYDVIYDFIIDFLSTKEENFKMGEKFVKFLEKINIEDLIVEIFMSELTARQGRFPAFILSLVKFSIQNEEIFKKFLLHGLFFDDKKVKKKTESKVKIELTPEVLAFIGHDPNQFVVDEKKLQEGPKATLFQMFFKHNLGRNFFCAELLNILRNSGIKNWHKLTGFGEKFEESEINFLISEKIEEIFDNKETNLENSLMKIETENEFFINSNHQEIENIKLTHQLLLFILAVDDIPENRLEYFLKLYVAHHAILTIKCSKLIEIFFQIAEKYFFNLKEKFSMILAIFMNSLVADLSKVQENFINSKILENFISIFSKIEEFFTTNLNLIKFSMTTNLKTKSSILRFAIVHKLTNVKKFFKNYFETKEILEILTEGLPENLSFEQIKELDEICFDLSGFSTVFKIFFNYCENFNEILKLFGNLKKVFGEDFENQTRYEKIINEKKSLNDLDVMKLKISTINDQFDCKENFEIFRQFLSFVNRFEIPNEDLKRFLKNNLTKILQICLNYDEIFIDQIFEIINLKVDFENDEEKVEILKSSVLDLKIFASDLGSLKISVLNYFYLKLEEKFKNFSKFKDFLNLQCENSKLNHFLLGINFDCQNIVKIYHKHLSNQEISKIILTNIHNFNFDDLNVESFFEYFKNFTNLNLSSFDERNLNENSNYNQEVEENFVKMTNNELQSNFEKAQKFSSVIYQILKYISQNEIFKEDLQIFLKKNFTLFSFRSKMMIEIFFEVLRKNFKDEKIKAAEIIKNLIIETKFSFESEMIIKMLGALLQQMFYTERIWLKNENISKEVLECFECFWENLEKFCASDSEILKIILLSDYEKNHPFIFGIYYKIKNLLKIYIEYFNVEEILEIFSTKNLMSFSRFFDVENFRKFLNDYFMSDENKKEKLIEFLKKNENLFLKTTNDRIKFFENMEGEAYVKMKENLIGLENTFRKIVDT